MVIEGDNVHISITTIPAASFVSSAYDLILPTVDSRSEYDLDAVTIEIVKNGKRSKVALIGDTSANETDCAVLNGDVLSVLQDWTLYHINIETCELVSTTKIDSWCPNFNIYRIQDGYIILGETDVTMLDHGFNTLWSFGGNDVFSPMDPALKPIELCEDKIKLYDFNGDYYELNYSGKLIASRKNEGKKE